GGVAALAAVGVQRSEQRAECVAELEQLRLCGAGRPTLHLPVRGIPAGALDGWERARRFAEEVPLEQVRAERDERVALLHGLHAFGDHADPEITAGAVER